MIPLLKQIITLSGSHIGPLSDPQEMVSDRLTHWGQDKMAANADEIFKWIFLNKNV